MGRTVPPNEGQYTAALPACAVSPLTLEKALDRRRGGEARAAVIGSLGSAAGWQLASVADWQRSGAQGCSGLQPPGPKKPAARCVPAGTV